jgi:hypothetical protein
VIASSTRGFAVPQAGTPPMISTNARPPQHQDEKGSVRRVGPMAAGVAFTTGLLVALPSMMVIHRFADPSGPVGGK